MAETSNARSANPAETCAPPIGARVTLRHAIDRYPHFIAPAGSTGTVVDIGDPNIYAVRMDETLPGAEDWSNEVHWILDTGDDPASALSTDDARKG